VNRDGERRELLRFGDEAFRLGCAIEFAARPEVQARARALGEQMRAENGIATAISAIEALVRERR
jgi:hypothetical protein